jgi:hypothetical protein
MNHIENILYAVVLKTLSHEICDKSNIFFVEAFIENDVDIH